MNEVEYIETPANNTTVSGQKSFTDDPVLDVRHATLRYIFSHPLFYFAGFLILAGGVLFGYYTSEYMVAFVISFVLLFVLYALVQKRIRDSLIQQFARSLGYDFALTGDLSGVDGALFCVGHEREMSDVISGKDSGHPTRVFCYSYTTGEGKSKQVHVFTVFERTFDSIVPHIMLHRPDGIFSDDVPIFSGGVSLTLEGDFNKHFSLEVEKDFEMEAYEIFTPDVMQELIETSKKFNFEFYRNKLYIYMPKLIDTRNELDAMFTLSKKLCFEIEPEILGMKGDVLAVKETLNKGLIHT